MAVKRNGTCPCGSGKKYKKCCMQKESAKEIIHLRIQRFHHQKELLQGKMSRFIRQYMGTKQLNRLRYQFKARLNHSLDTSILDIYFQIWLAFYYRDEENLRGCDIFYNHNLAKLSFDEKRFLEKWLTLSPRVLQYSQQQGDGIIIEDYYTKEQFYLPYNEQLPKIVPSNITVAMIEEHDHGYDVHGIASWVSPIYLTEIKKTINALENHYPDKPLCHIISDYYPEIIAIIEGGVSVDEILAGFSKSKGRTKAELTSEDVIIHEKLGFSETDIQHFYSDDIIQFFKEKTNGKSDATVLKYTSGLRIIVSFLEDNSINSWETCSTGIWHELIAFSYLDRVFDATVSQAKALFSTLNIFTQWLDNHYGTSHGVSVKKAIDIYQNDVFQSIQVLDQIVPYQIRKQHDSYDSLQPHLANVVTGIFNVISKNDGLTLQNIIDQKTYVIESNSLKEGMFIYATLSPTNDSGDFRLSQLDRLYPASSRAFIEKELGFNLTVL